MIELSNNELCLRFPEIHPDAQCRVSFQRTLRIPDDNREYPLPPGLGRFPIRHVEDHAENLPAAWREHGGVLLPMYQAEALWISFARGGYPFALKIAAGKIDAVTGKAWSNGLTRDPQDYVVVTQQPWLDGFCIRKGLIRQFVAMPLGRGYTAEEQLTGAAEHGGIQIIAYPMRRERYEKLQEEQRRERARMEAMPLMAAPSPVAARAKPPAEMGLAPGGLMRQHIYADRYGFDAWDQTACSRCFVHILNTEQWQTATGAPAPGAPPTAADYTKAGLPWFDYYSEEAALDGSERLAGLDSIAAKGVKKSEVPLPENEAVKPSLVVQIERKLRGIVEGRW